MAVEYSIGIYFIMSHRYLMMTQEQIQRKHLFISSYHFIEPFHSTCSSCSPNGTLGIVDYVLVFSSVYLAHQSQMR